MSTRRRLLDVAAGVAVGVSLHTLVSWLWRRRQRHESHGSSDESDDTASPPSTPIGEWRELVEAGQRVLSGITHYYERLVSGDPSLPVKSQVCVYVCVYMQGNLSSRQIYIPLVHVCTCV
jgi:hypothetical protein